MKINRTPKLFYKKYAYKIELRVKGAQSIQYSGVENTIHMCDQHLAGQTVFKFRDYNNEDLENLKKFAKTVKKYLKPSIKSRVEYYSFNFYLEDKVQFNKMIKNLKPWIRSVTQPTSDEDLAALLNNNKVVICNKLPLKKYKYRVFFNRRMPVNRRETFYTWLENYGDSVRISKSSKRWIQGHGWMYDPYMYIEDSKLLLMAKMSLGEYAGKTEEFVLSNTVK